MKPAGNIEQNVIACAHRLFIEKGYVNTSMSDIAAAVGITRPALHYYFRTKERLDRIIDEYVALFLNNPDLPYFMIVNHLIEAARELKIDKYILDIQNALKTAMREGILRPVPDRFSDALFATDLPVPDEKSGDDAAARRQRAVLRLHTGMETQRPVANGLFAVSAR